MAEYARFIDDRHDVIIPAWNEERTITQNIFTLAAHDRIKTIIVAVDPQTIDRTLELATSMTTYVVACHSFIGVTVSREHGKGQVVQHALEFAQRFAIEPTARVLLCDADITGLTSEHISALTKPSHGMVIGIPDVPPNLPDFAVTSWPWVSGQRAVPRDMLHAANVHGYLMETQLNRYAEQNRLSIDHEYLPGLKSRFNMTTQRVQDMEFYKQWGIKNGILRPTGKRSAIPDQRRSEDS
jgi:glycosyltransferase involved in cell wall biosynthesis